MTFEPTVAEGLGTQRRTQSAVSPAQQPSITTGRCIRDDSFWIFFWFGVITAVIKSTLAHVPWTFHPNAWPELGKLPKWTSWGRDIAYMIPSDILFAIIGGLIAQTLLRLAYPWPRLRLGLWWFYLLFCTVGVFFTIVNVPIYTFTFAPFNYTLLDLLGGFPAIPRLAVRFLTLRWAIAFITWPMMYLLLVWLSVRVSRRKQSQLFVICQVTLIAASLYYVTTFHPYALIILAGISAVYLVGHYIAAFRWVPTRRTILLAAQLACILGIWLLLGQYRAYRVVALVLVPLLYVGLLWAMGGQIQVIPAVASLVFAAGCIAWILIRDGWVAVYLASALGVAPLVYLLTSRIIDRRRVSHTGIDRQAIYPLLQALCLLALFSYMIDVHIRLYVKRVGWRPPHDDRRITDSTYASFLHSCWAELFRDPTVRCRGKFRPDDLRDFQTFDEARENGTVVFPTPNLPRRPKNVIFFVLESVGTRYMSLYGSHYPSTPKLQAAANECLIFNNVYAPVANSGQSLISMVLSVYAPLTWREYTRDKPDMKGTAISQVLHDRGYRTAFMASLDWTYADGDKFLHGRGFDDIWDYHDLPGPKTGYWGVDDSQLIDKALQWVKQDRSKPFFLMCWNQGTHDPYEWSETYYSNYDDYLKLYDNNNRGLYGSMWWHITTYLNALHHLDEQLGRLFQGLKDAGLADDTLVVLVGDHGECFGEPHPSYGHAGDLYQAGINVPCILWNPAMFKSMPRSQTLGHMNDVPATILDILAVPAPGGWQGRSLLSPDRSPRVYFYGPRDFYMLGLREQTAEHDFKYICNTLSAERGDELYDLWTDPEEKVNIASEKPAEVHRYRQRIAAWLAYEMNKYRDR